MRKVFVWIVMMLIVFAGPAAHAQSAPAPRQALHPAFSLPGDMDRGRPVPNNADPMKSAIFLNLPPDLQDELLEKSQKFYVDCQGKGSYTQTHDCACLALRYLSARLERPDASDSSINVSIMNECVDTAATAGYAYNKCKALYSTMYPENIEQLCECYGRRYAQSYARQPNVNAQYEINLGSDVILSCRRDAATVTTVPRRSITDDDLNSLKPY